MGPVGANSTDAVLREIHMADGLIGLLQDLPYGQREALQHGVVARMPTFRR